MHLQRQLAGDDVLLATIGRRLRHSALQANHFADHSDDIAASCAAVYQDTISTYRYRIKINGSVAALASPRSVNRIRALLLARYPLGNAMAPVGRTPLACRPVKEKNARRYRAISGRYAATALKQLLISCRIVTIIFY